MASLSNEDDFENRNVPLRDGSDVKTAIEAVSGTVKTSLTDEFASPFYVNKCVFPLRIPTTDEILSCTSTTGSLGSSRLGSSKAFEEYQESKKERLDDSSSEDSEPKSPSCTEHKVLNYSKKVRQANRTVDSATKRRLFRNSDDMDSLAGSLGTLSFKKLSDSETDEDISDDVFLEGTDEPVQNSGPFTPSSEELSDIQPGKCQLSREHLSCQKMNETTPQDSRLRHRHVLQDYSTVDSSRNVMDIQQPFTLLGPDRWLEHQYLKVFSSTDEKDPAPIDLSTSNDQKTITQHKLFSDYSSQPGTCPETGEMQSSSKQIGEPDPHRFSAGHNQKVVPKRKIAFNDDALLTKYRGSEDSVMVQIPPSKKRNESFTPRFEIGRNCLKRKLPSPKQLFKYQDSSNNQVEESLPHKSRKIQSVKRRNSFPLFQDKERS